VSAVPFSCCIITRDEADRIAACIEAVKPVADEIVVVDSGSTDDTVAIAEGLGARVFHRDWVGYGPQKRFAESCARHDWILNLDADEIVTPEFRREIAALMQAEPPFGAYRMRLVPVYPGQTRPRPLSSAHNHVRFYDRRRARFHDSLVHDTVDTGDLPVGQIRSPVLHYSLRSLDHLRRKLDSYTALQAKELRKPAWKILLRLPFEYPAVFLRYYLVRRNFTGGWFGLGFSHISAEMRVRRLLRILAAGRAARRTGDG